MHVFFGSGTLAVPYTASATIQTHHIESVPFISKGVKSNQFLQVWYDTVKQPFLALDVKFIPVSEVRKGKTRPFK